MVSTLILDDEINSTHTADGTSIGTIALKIVDLIRKFQVYMQTFPFNILCRLSNWSHA